MRQILFGVLSTLVCLTFGLRTVYAQGGGVDMSKCITLTVKQGARINLGFAASTSGVKVKVVGVEGEKEEEAPTSLHKWNELPQYAAKGTEIKVYGAIDKFTCSYNYTNLTALDVSQNVNLTELLCDNNQLSALDVHQNGELTYLNCDFNHLSSLDISQNVKLTELFCKHNQLSSLDVSQNVNLIDLRCSDNQLSSLDVSQNTQLREIWIYGNNFSTSALNSLYCQLPNRKWAWKGYIYPIYRIGDKFDELLTFSSSGAIAGLKNWTVQYKEKESLFLYTADNYKCGTDYALTFSPVAMSNSFSHQGGEWKTTVKSTGNWKVDETVPLPSWIKVEPKEGKTGSQVTITVSANKYKNYIRRSAVTFVLADDKTTRQVVLLTQTYPYISVTPSNNYMFPATGEKKENYFTVESSGKWTLTCDVDWLQIEPKEGDAGKTKVTITAKPNSSKDARTTELTFAHKDNSEIKQVVTLKQKEASIAVTPAEEYNFPAAGEKKENYFTVESTGKWTLTCDANWLQIEPKEGEAGETTVTITAEANSSNARMAKLTFALKDNSEIKQVVTIKQKEASIAVTPVEEYTFLAAGEKKENYFTVESTGKWTLTYDADWLEVEQKEGNAGQTQVTITAQPNSSKEARTAELTFALKDNGEIKQVVTLKQKGAISITPANGYTFPAAGEKKENYFTVESSREWTLTYDADWLQIEPKEGDAGETKVTIKADPNSSKDARTAKLTFALKDNNEIKQMVTLKQKGDPNAAVEDALFADVVVSPNPFHNQLRITNGNLEGEYILLNTQGVKVASGVLEVSETLVNTSELSAGIYLLQLNAKGGATKTYRVVK